MEIIKTFIVTNSKFALKKVHVLEDGKYVMEDADGSLHFISEDEFKDYQKRY